MDFRYPPNSNFECNMCGLCCGDTKGKTRHILLLPKEVNCITEFSCQSIEKFAESVFNKEPYTYEMKKNKHGKCFFLNDNRCTIYDLRPLICRFYPFEMKFAKEKDSHVFEVTLECPTVGKGKKLTRQYFEDLFILAKERLC